MARKVPKHKMSIFSASGGPREKLNPFLESSFRVNFGFVDADEVNVMNLVFPPNVNLLSNLFFSLAASSMP